MKVNSRMIGRRRTTRYTVVPGLWRVDVMRVGATDDETYDWRGRGG